MKNRVEFCVRFIFSKSVRQIVVRKLAQQLIFDFDIKEPIASDLGQ